LGFFYVLSIKISEEWLTMWLTENTNLYIQPKMEQKC
jgi:hypothetical protein